MNVLIIGSGGREHTFAWKICQSPLLTRLFIAPGNAGTAELGENIAIAIDDFVAIKKIVLEKKIDLVLVGPEDPLVKGIHDFFIADEVLQKVPVIGPQKLAATLEGSKEFAKQFMYRHSIPTAEYFTATKENISDAFSFMERQQSPYVLKADGLAAGKGVLIIEDLVQAKEELQSMLAGKFGTASKKVVIEECLKGIELSTFVLTDGESYLVLPEAKDYKRIGEKDTGLNTGGMGAVSPVPFANREFLTKVEERIIKPTIEGLKKDSIPYNGFIFIGLMNVNGDPKVIEYNVRMGDPETEVVMPRLKSDFLEILAAVGKKNLKSIKSEFYDEIFTTVMVVSGGYPEEYKKNFEIRGLDQQFESVVFHAGTSLQQGKILTSGGRVLTVTSSGKDIKEALAKSYNTIKKIDFEGMYFRKDIGLDLI